MRIKKNTAFSPSPERRQFGRINLREPRMFNVRLPQSRELWVDQGFLLNISLGGICFLCDTQPPLKKNDILYITFDTTYQDQKAHLLWCHGLVVRTENRQLDLPQFAVALKFLSNPIYYPPHEADNRDCAPLDKPRIMYQYYDLNKKAYEIIHHTPEIRTGKIKNIKEYIDQGLYNVDSEKITQSVIHDIFLKNILLPKK
jgi:hypothetical protein